jgi:hypothetical protein
MANHRKMKLTVDIESQQEPGHVHHVGATGILVEPLGANAWLVEVRVPDPTLEGDAWYETLEVRGDEFELIDQRLPARSRSARELIVGPAELSRPWADDAPPGEPPPMPEGDRLAV